MEKIDTYTHKIPEFKLIIPSISDSRTIWKWRNDELTRKMSKDNKFIEWDIHQDWFNTFLSDETSFIYLAKINKISFGVSKFELINEGNYLISININPTLREKGLGKLLLEYSMKRFFKDSISKPYIFAEIRKINKKSICIFESFGFELTYEQNDFYTYKYRLK